MVNSEDPDEMQHNAAFHQGLHCLLRLKQLSWMEIHNNLENSTCDSLNYTMGILILIASMCMGKLSESKWLTEKYRGQAAHQVLVLIG